MTMHGGAFLHGWRMAWVLSVTRGCAGQP